MVERNVGSIPELWHGHSLDDDCSWEEEVLSPLDKIKDLVRPFINYGGERRVFNKLKEFLRNLPQSPVERFGYGQVFDMGKFPKGTIVKFSYEYVESDSAEHFDEEWGIITQERESGEISDVIVGFSIDDFTEKFQLDNATRIYDSTIKIGEGVHTRTSSAFGKTQDLTRFNFIEVWRIGS